MIKKLYFWITLLAVLLVGVAILRWSPSSSQWLWSLSNNGSWIFPLVTVAAVMDSINPCAFSILLLTIAFFFSVGKLRSEVLRVGSFYIAGIFVVYILIGLGILQTLHLFSTPHFMAKVGATALIILGIVNLIEIVWPNSPIKLRIPSVSHAWMGRLVEQGTLPAVFALGVLVGLCEFPCTGGPYLMVLGLLHDQSSFWNGFWYLLYYNVLFILPLIIILMIASNKTLLEKVQLWQKQERNKLRLWSGVIMVLLGLSIFLF